MRNIRKLKILKNLLILSLIFVFFSCIGEIKSPVLPTWESEFKLPLIDRSETLAELIKNEKNIFIDSATMLIKFDSTKTESKPINEIFKDDIKFDNHSVVKISTINSLRFSTVISDDSVNLEEAKILYGALNYTVHNHLDKNIQARIAVPGFKKNNTDTLKFDIFVNSKSSATKKINLSNYHYKVLPQYPNGIYVEGEFTVFGDNYSGDSISLDFKLDSLAFNYIKAKTKPYFTEIKPSTSYIDLDKDAKDILPKVDIKGAKVYLSSNINYNDNIEVRLKNFQVIGLFKNGAQPKLLKINGKTTLDTIVKLNKTQILSVDNFEINEFLYPEVPDSITYKGELVFNPFNKTIEIFLPDTIKYTYRLEIASIIKMNDASKTDTVKIDPLDQDQKDNLDRVLGGEITIELDNYFPVGMQLIAYLTDSTYKKLIYISREKGDGSTSDTIFSISPAPVNSQGEATGQVTTQKKKFKITKEEVQKVKEVRYLIFNVIAYTTEKKMVYVRPNMKYYIRVYGSFKLNIDTEKSK